MSIIYLLGAIVWFAVALDYGTRTLHNENTNKQAVLYSVMYLVSCLMVCISFLDFIHAVTR